MRVGQGFDAHAFAEGEGLRLGGVQIPFDRTVAAHSDGDVVLHALTDALLGAAGLGDMGVHFPSEDDRWKGADSRLMLREVVERLRQRGLAVHNVDVTVICQAPRLSPHVDGMKRNVAADLSLEPGAVSIKATTTDGLGFTGRGDGIAALAVVLLDEFD